MEVRVYKATRAVANMHIVGKYSVLDPVQSTFHLFSSLSKLIILGFYHNLHLKGEDLRYREIKQPVQSHTSRK